MLLRHKLSPTKIAGLWNTFKIVREQDKAPAHPIFVQQREERKIEPINTSELSLGGDEGLQGEVSPG